MISPASETAQPCGTGGIVLETGAIFALMFLFACSPAPGVNESHYLIKARHYWDPAWCERDFFLATADAHLLFYWTCGWLTRLLSLETTAWVGRVVSWLFLAWSWQQLSFAAVPRRWLAPVTAGVFLLLIERCHMAGEWVVGGFEAKGFAYGFLFLGLAALLHNRWRSVFPLLGCASAWHVVTGGWGVLIAGGVWLVLWLRGDLPRATAPLRQLAISLTLGFLCSLPGLLPCLLLNRGVPDDVVREGNLIYVFIRLQHHLVISSFPTMYWVRHAALLVVTLWLAGAIPRHERMGRLFLFASGCVLLMLVGLVIDRLTPWLGRETAAAALRYYWFRLTDAGLPIVCSLTLLWWWNRWQGARFKSLLLLAIVVASGWNVGERMWQRHVANVPPAMNTWLKDKQQSPFSRRELYLHWLACCQWIRTETPQDALFLTTSTPATFVWHAERAEVVSWKNAPQDAQGLVEWLARYENVRNQQKLHGPSIAPTQPPEIRWQAVARQYGAEYIVIERRREPLPGWERVYPRGEEWNPTFAVYRVPKP